MVGGTREAAHRDVQRWRGGAGDGGVDREIHALGVLDPGRSARRRDRGFGIRARERIDPMRKQQIAALVALVVGAATVALAVAVAVSEFPRGLFLLALVLVAGASAWYGVLRRGIARAAGLAVAGLALAGSVALILGGGTPLGELLVAAGLLVSLAAARAAIHVHVDLPSAVPPAPGGALLQSALGWRQSGALLARGRGTRPRDRADRAEAGRRPRGTRSGSGGPGCRRARDGRR